MKKLTKIAALMMAAVLSLSLTGCSMFQDFDATKYVKSTLDAIFYGELTEYMEIVDATEAEAQAEYDEAIDMIADSLITEFRTISGSITQEQEDEIKEIAVKFLANASFKVEEAKKVDKENFDVDVVITPLVSIDEAIETFAEDYMGEYNDRLEAFEENAANATEDNYDELMAEAEALDELGEGLYDGLVEELLTVYRNYINNPEYKDDQTVTVRVFVEGNYWTMSESDLDTLMSAAFGM